jgi:transcriptional regulator of aromatic amino acid metabolism
MYSEFKYTKDGDWYPNSCFEGVFNNNFKPNNTYDYVSCTSRFDFNILLKTINFDATYIEAQYIHRNSIRNTKSFIRFNCEKVSKDLIDIELFGCEPGTYKNFPEGKKGILEAYNGGTVYLEEVSELPLYAQYKLIDLVEEGILSKSGSNKKIIIDVKLIASTKKDLNKLMEKGLFVEGLYYSLIEM